MKLDLSDPDKDLTDLERDFLETLVCEIKLSEAELEAKFGGAERLSGLRNNIEIRRVAAEIKMAKSRRRNLIDKYKLDKIVATMPVALKGLVEIAKTGKEHNRLEACKFLLKPAVAYLEKHGMQIAELESIDGNEDKFNFTLNVAPIESKSN